MSEEKKDFKVGDVVRLKSGGPNMTIHYIGTSSSGRELPIQCMWFDSENKGPYKEEIYKDALTSVNKN